jgi:lipoprotein-anchoring transpeptidase ErfK/SrfK
LIALGLVIAVGAIFTARKLTRTPDETANRPGTAGVLPIHPDVLPRPMAPSPAAKPSVIVEARPGTSPQAAPAPVVAEPTALITRTPTERVASADSSRTKSPAPTAPLPTLAAAGAPILAAVSDAGEGDSTALAQWASSARKPGTDPALSSNAASLAGNSSTTSSPPARAVAPSATPAVAPVAVSADPSGDAKARIDTGDFITARQILNDALIAGRPDADNLKTQIEQLNQTLVFSPRRIPEDPWGGIYQVASGERLGSIANRCNVPWELLARINNVTPKKLRAGQWIKLVKGPFHAVVTKHAFRMDLYLGAPGGPGSMFIRSFPVGLGKDNSTPTGLWLCKSGDKIRNPRYYPPRGGDIIAPDDPKNPLGGYWIAIEGAEGQALGKESYGIHGTIDPTSIGKMESMGCIRLKPEDIALVFDMLTDGKSKIVVKE